MFKCSAVSQIWKKYIQKLNDWDLPLKFSICFRPLLYYICIHVLLDAYRNVSFTYMDFLFSATFVLFIYYIRYMYV